MAEFDVHVAFGLRCLSAAMTAKAGRQTRADRVALVDMANLIVPDDIEALDAVTTFARDSAVDAFAAGAALHSFIQTWRRGVMAADSDRLVRSLATIRADSGAHDWQGRADCGL